MNKRDIDVQVKIRYVSCSLRMYCRSYTQAQVMRSHMWSAFSFCIQLHKLQDMISMYRKCRSISSFSYIISGEVPLFILLLGFTNDLRRFTEALEMIDENGNSLSNENSPWNMKVSFSRLISRGSTKFYWGDVLHLCSINHVMMLQKKKNGMIAHLCSLLNGNSSALI